MGWRLSWDEDRSWSETDVTVAQALVVGELLERDDWQSMDPAGSPRACIAWLSVLLASAAGVSIEEAQAAVLARPLAFLVAALTFDEEPAAEA
jgi:hypothetical protein